MFFCHIDKSRNFFQLPGPSQQLNKTWQCWVVVWKQQVQVIMLPLKRRSSHQLTFFVHHRFFETWLCRTWFALQELLKVVNCLFIVLLPKHNVSHHLKGQIYVRNKVPKKKKKGYGQLWRKTDRTNQSCIFVKLVILQNDAALLLARIDLIQSEVQPCQLQHHLGTGSAFIWIHVTTFLVENFRVDKSDLSLKSNHQPLRSQNFKNTSL